jgi:hypothetical protein
MDFSPRYETVEFVLKPELQLSTYSMWGGALLVTARQC